MSRCALPLVLLDTWHDALKFHAARASKVQITYMYQDSVNIHIQPFTATRVAGISQSMNGMDPRPCPKPHILQTPPTTYLETMLARKKAGLDAQAPLAASCHRQPALPVLMQQPCIRPLSGLQHFAIEMANFLIYKSHLAISAHLYSEWPHKTQSLISLAGILLSSVGRITVCRVRERERHTQNGISAGPLETPRNPPPGMFSSCSGLP